MKKEINEEVARKSYWTREKYKNNFFTFKNQRQPIRVFVSSQLDPNLQEELN